MSNIQRTHTAPILATRPLVSKAGKQYGFGVIVEGIAQELTLFTDDAAKLKEAWTTFPTNDAGQRMVPLVVIVKKDADRVVEGVTVPGYTNYTAKLANVTADIAPF